MKTKTKAKRIAGLALLGVLVFCSCLLGTQGNVREALILNAVFYVLMAVIALAMWLLFSS